MFRSYVGVIAVLCLVVAVGCDSSSENPGGSGGSAGTGGTAGSGGTGGTAGSGGSGGTGGSVTPETKAISLGCGNNVTTDVSILEWELSVAPDSNPIAAGESFDASLGGVATFSEAFLDVAQGVITGGLNKAGLVDLGATVQTRGDGATGDNVKLTGGGDIPYECWISDTGSGAQEACDPANNQPSVPGNVGNTDCAVVASINPCLRIIEIPTSDDCSVGGVCDNLGKKASQCDINGFCVTGGLPIPLDPQTGSYTAGDGSADALFGWFDDPADDSPAVATPAIDGDGTYNMVKPPYTGTAGVVGLAVYAGLSVQVECVMAVDSNGPDGVGVPDDASPSPDSAMLSIPVE